MASPLIRLASATDLPEITDIYNEVVLNGTATFDTEPKSLENRTQWLKIHPPDRYPVIVAVGDDGTITGWGCLSAWSERAAYDGTAENSVYVHSEKRGQQIGRTLLEELIKRAREIGFHTIVARITAESDASVALHEAFGFERAGTLKEVGKKFGRLLDVHLYQLLL